MDMIVTAASNSCHPPIRGVSDEPDQSSRCGIFAVTEGLRGLDRSSVNDGFSRAQLGGPPSGALVTGGAPTRRLPRQSRCADTHRVPQAKPSVHRYVLFAANGAHPAGDNRGGRRVVGVCSRAPAELASPADMATRLRWVQPMLGRYLVRVEVINEIHRAVNASLDPTRVADALAARAAAWLPAASWAVVGPGSSDEVALMAERGLVPDADMAARAVVTMPGTATTVEEFLQAADDAMHWVKAHGKGGSQLAGAASRKDRSA